ncbi:MAG: hypothetical protein M3Y83_01105, partial [Actinomycetota bacterium]|nr:hypothetical protein [Actinomycetota bacterium]
MELAARPLVTTGVAIIGATALIANPVAAPAPEIAIPSLPSLSANNELLASVLDLPAPTLVTPADAASALTFLITQTSELINAGLITVAEGITFGATQFAALVAAGATTVTGLVAAAAELGVFLNTQLAELVIFGVTQAAGLVNFAVAQAAAALVGAGAALVGVIAAGAEAFVDLIAAAAEAGTFYTSGAAELVVFALNSVLPAPFAAPLEFLVTFGAGLVNFGITAAAAGLAGGTEAFVGLLAAG